MTAIDAHTHPGQQRYSMVAMALHWLIALAVILLLGSGLAMTRMAPGLLAFDLYQWHKALGITVLALSVLRLLWRLTHRPPPLPDDMPRLERLGAKLGHLGFYALLIGLPLGGWAMVSVSPLNVPTSWFGLFVIPHLPGAPDDLATRKSLEGLFKLAHEVGGWMMLALLVLHVAAGLRHALVLRDGVFDRMVPAGRQRGFVLAAILLPVLTIGALVATGGPVPGPAPLAEAPSSAPAPSAPVPAAAAGATGWIIDPAASRLGFRGTQLGAVFEGSFQRFRAEIDFDPATPETGRAEVVVETGSASTGDAQRDTALPTADWFAVADFPEARFVAETFRRTGENAYVAEGTLTLRGITQPLALPFTLVEEGGATRARGEVTLIRSAFGVGQGQFEAGDWVALEVVVTIDLLARRAE